MDELEKSPITGTEIAYLYICHRKLWLFRKWIRPENEHTNVQIGKFIQESTFLRHMNKKEVPLGHIGRVDWAELDKGVIHEMKKSKAPANAENAQTRYYIWWMRSKGIPIYECIIHYPKQKRTKKMIWDKEMGEHVEQDLAEVRKIIYLSKVPSVNEKTYCKSCAYEEFCFA